MGQIQTMTPAEAAEELRSHGFSIKHTTLQAGLRQGAFPFGIYIDTKEGNPVYKIFRKQFEQWIEERSM